MPTCQAQGEGRPDPPAHLRLQTPDASLLFPEAPEVLGYDVHPVVGAGRQQAAEGQCPAPGAFPPPCPDAQALRVHLGATEPLWAPEFRVLRPLGHGGEGASGLSPSTGRTRRVGVRFAPGQEEPHEYWHQPPSVGQAWPSRAQSRVRGCLLEPGHVPTQSRPSDMRGHASLKAAHHPQRAPSPASTSWPCREGAGPRGWLCGLGAPAARRTGRAPPHLCAAFRSSSSWLSLRRFSSSLRKFSFCTASQVTTFWSSGSGRSLSGEPGSLRAGPRPGSPMVGRPSGLPQRGPGPAAPCPRPGPGPGPLRPRGSGRSLTQARPLLRGPPLQEPLEHQAQVAEEDERGRQCRALVVLHDEVEALELPEGVRVALHHLERVAAGGGGGAACWMLL